MKQPIFPIRLAVEGRVLLDIETNEELDLVARVLLVGYGLDYKTMMEEEYKTMMEEEKTGEETCGDCESYDECWSTDEQQDLLADTCPSFTKKEKK